ncbi:uncharacterized protein [Typha latifolia]|uniref:uncharacterized protein isoform X2 n=1 Tax=Typha latifolia TaxID=4733 RepID=UPI003C2DD50B
MDPSSYTSLLDSSIPLKHLEHLEESNFPALPLPEELNILCQDLSLPSYLYNVGSPVTLNPQVSSDFNYPISKETVFSLDSTVSLEDLDFIGAQLDFRVDTNAAPNVVVSQNQNVGIVGSAETFGNHHGPVQNAHLQELSEAYKIVGGGKEEEKKPLQVATVSVDLIRNKRPFKCMHDGCEKTFKNPQTLSMHHRTHYKSLGDGLHPNAAKAGQNKKIPCRCPVCGRVFVGLYELRRHFGRKHSEGEKMHSCRKCGKKFYIEVDLRDHEKLCGEMVGCKCGLKFAFKCNLLAHKKTHPECVGESSNPLNPRIAGKTAGSESKSPYIGMMGVKLEDIWALSCHSRLSVVKPQIFKENSLD